MYLVLNTIVTSMMFDNYHYLFIYFFFTIHVTFICVLLFVCGVGTSRCYVGATITPCIILFFLFLFFYVRGSGRRYIVCFFTVCYCQCKALCDRCL